jgi:capsular polysaccharide biosynthesis protein
MFPFWAKSREARGVGSPPDPAMTFPEAIAALRARWWVLLAAAVVAAVAAYAYIKAPWVEPRWRSSVLMQATGRLDYGNFLALEKELRPLAEQVMQLDIMRHVDQNLHTDLAPEIMLEHTRAEPVVDSDQIRIDVEDSDSTRAEQISLAIADVYTQQHNAAEQGKLREERVILSTLDRPNQAILIWPQTRIVVPAAGLLGLLLAGMVVLGAAYFDDTIRSPADIRRYLDVPLLGSIPRFRTAGPAHPATLAGASEPEDRSPEEMEVPTGAARTRL